MNTIESIYIHKTVVDNNNIMWSMSLDKQDNTVTITSDYATLGTSAVLSQYSMDNALGQDIPEQILTSANDMIIQDDTDELNTIINRYNEARNDHVDKTFNA